MTVQGTPVKRMHRTRLLLLNIIRKISKAANCIVKNTFKGSYLQHLL